MYLPTWAWERYFNKRVSCRLVHLEWFTRGARSDPWQTAQSEPAKESRIKEPANSLPNLGKFRPCFVPPSAMCTFMLMDLFSCCFPRKRPRPVGPSLQCQLVCIDLRGPRICWMSGRISSPRNHTCKYFPSLIWPNLTSGLQRVRGQWNYTTAASSARKTHRDSPCKRGVSLAMLMTRFL